MIGIAAPKLLAMPGAEAMKAQMVEMIEGETDIYRIAEHGFVDEIIDPRETRDALITGLELTREKTVERPWRRHGIEP